MAAGLVLCMAAFAAAQKPAPHGAAAKPSATIEQAETLMEHQSWPEAEPILRKLAVANPKNSRVWFDLGYVMHAQKNYPEAIAAYQSAVAAEPQSFECNLNLGMMLAHEHRPEASKYLEAATHLKPTGNDPKQSLARAWTALAEVEESSGSAEALNSWGHAVELAPSDARRRLAYGVALERAGKSTEAEQQLRKASELEPNSTDALAALANLYMRGRRLPEAEQTLVRLVSAAPQDESTHLQLGHIYSAEGKDTEAAAELQKALTLKPDDWDALRELAFVQEHGKQYAEAAGSYRQLVAQFPADAELHNGLGTVLLAQHNYAEAQSELLACVRLKPQWGEAYGQLAQAASGNKDYALAIQALDARKKLLPELPVTYFLRATCYDHLRHFVEAVENYKAFLAVANGQFPDDEWKARHRLIAIEPEAKRQK